MHFNFKRISEFSKNIMCELKLAVTKQKYYILPFALCFTVFNFKHK